MMTKKHIHQLLLSSLLAIGACGGCTFVGTWAIEALLQSGSENQEREQISFMSDGTPLLVHYVGEEGRPEYRDLDRKLVLPDVEDSGVIPAWLGTNWPQMIPISSIRLSNGQTPAAYWYLLEDATSNDGHGYFVGFDSHSKRRIGYIGLAGFREQPPTREEMFPGIRRGSGAMRPESEKGLYFISPQSGSLFQYAIRELDPPAVWEIYVPCSDGKLYLADLQKRSVSIVYDGPPMRSAAPLLRSIDSRHREIWQVAIRTDEAVLVLDATGKIHNRFSIPESLTQEDFQFCVTKDGEAVIEWVHPEDSLTTTTPVRLFRVNADGRTNETPVTLTHNATGRRFQAYGGLIIPSPLVLAGTIGLDRVSELVRYRVAPTFGKAVLQACAEYWPTFSVALIIALVFSCLCYLREKRYRSNWVERITWPLFVLILGLPGWIGYRFGRSWPVLEACPGCSMPSPRDRDDCATCGEEFLAPAELGTEVYA
ncbi:MAG TPA: hypothetical protein VGP68_00150 [Gemmataceae bacterium]|jgi:hypothetical protein|nr:hypothetical protein [Gemmataceae bacterium]